MSKKIMNTVNTSNKIAIGKHLLESLTVGLYKNPNVLFREYIQNALDAIDNAIDEELINENENEILVEVIKKKKTIRISDNGTGIKNEDMFFTLSSIGASTKDIDKSRGFRGIGRLSGLGYCSKIRFITSANSEDIKTEIVIDADSIRASFSQRDDIQNLDALMSSAISIDTANETPESHYFEVILEGVKDKNLLDLDSIKLYIAEIMPVPFDDRRFKHASKINNYLKNNKIIYRTYNIVVSNGVRKSKVYKLYHNNFRVNKSGTEVDKLSDVVIQKLYTESGEYLGWLWYGVCSFLGTVTDKRIKGLRVKKDGITIGDRFIINSLFKEDRFNGWLQGEIYLNNRSLIPNSRRDDFEHNEMYDTSKSVVKGTTDEICGLIYSAIRTNNENVKSNRINTSENSSVIACMDQLIDEVANNKKDQITQAFKEKYDNEELDNILNIINSIL